MSLRNNIIINSETETYAECTTVATDDNDPFDQPPLPREDNIETACSIFHDSCNVTVTLSNIVSAYRLQTRRADPRLLLVAFNS